MVQTVAVTKAITSLREVQDLFDLSRTDDPQFFTEWLTALPDLSHPEQVALDRLKTRYFYYAEEGAITEGTIGLMILAPLLELLGVCDPPYKIHSEKSVQVELDDPDADENLVLSGRIDALVIQDSLWIVVIEAKRYGFNVSLAVPQLLTYMMGHPVSHCPLYGMVMNGEDYLFVKLDPQQRRYDLSDKLTLSRRRGNALWDVVQVIKGLMGQNRQV